MAWVVIVSHEETVPGPLNLRTELMKKVSGGSRGGLLGVKTPFFLAIKIRAPLKGPFRGLFGTGPTFTVRGPGNELGASKVQKRATLRPPSAC